MATKTHGVPFHFFWITYLVKYLPGVLKKKTKVIPKKCFLKFDVD